MAEFSDELGDIYLQKIDNAFLKKLDLTRLTAGSRREENVDMVKKGVFSKSRSKEKREFGDEKDIEDTSFCNLDYESTERKLKSKRLKPTDNIRYAFRRMIRKKPGDDGLKIKYRTEEKAKSPYDLEEEVVAQSKTTCKPVKRNSRFTFYKPFKFSRSPYNPNMSYLKKKCEKMTRELDTAGDLNLNLSTEQNSFKTLLENAIRFKTTSTIKSPIDQEIMMFPTKTTEESLRNDFNIGDFTRELGLDPSYLGTRIDTFLPLDSSKIESTFSSFSYSKPTTGREIKDFQNYQNLNFERLNTLTQNDINSSDRTAIDARNAIAFEFFKIKRKRSLEMDAKQKENLSNLFYVLDSGRTEDACKPKRSPSRYSKGARQREDNVPCSNMKRSLPDFLRIKRFSLATKKRKLKQKENVDNKKRSKTNKKEKKEKRRRRNKSLQKSLNSSSFFPRLQPVYKKSVVEKDSDFKMMDNRYEQSKRRLKNLSQSLFNTDFMGAFENLKPLDDDISVKEYMSRENMI